MDQTLVDAITKALGYTENGGKPNLENLSAGRTGEMKSIFQFTPDTWKNYAGQVFGDPNTPLTPDHETHVVKTKVAGWLEKGYTPKQIASMWNAGVGEPDAYSGKFSNGQPSKGVNKKYGVPYDVPAYANKVDKYTQEFMKGKAVGNTVGAIAQAPMSNLASARPTGGEDPLAQLIQKIQSKQQAPTQPSVSTAQPSAARGLLQTLAGSPQTNK